MTVKDLISTPYSYNSYVKIIMFLKGQQLGIYKNLKQNMSHLHELYNLNGDFQINATVFSKGNNV